MNSFIGADGKARSVSTATPLPVDIGSGVTFELGASVEVNNDVGNPLPVSSVDLGARADTEATSDAGTFSLIALLKRALGRFTAINDKLPALISGNVPVAPNITRGGGAIDSNTQRVTLATDGPGVAALNSIAGLAIPAHDNLALTYTSGNLTSVAYRTGATTVATLTLAYNGSNQLTSVSRS